MEAETSVRRHILLLALVATLTACMGGLDVMVERGEPVATGGRFFVIPGLDEARAGRSSRLASDYIYGRLDAMVASALAERGFDRTLDASRADLVVHYSVFAKEWKTLKSVPPPPLSQPPPGWDRVVDGAYNGSYTDVKVEDHREGTMVVDVVATASGKLVHRFYIEGALGEDAKDNLETAEDAIRDGFDRFGAER